jgi:hypothetical protein
MDEPCPTDAMTIHWILNTYIEQFTVRIEYSDRALTTTTTFEPLEMHS